MRRARDQLVLVAAASLGTGVTELFFLLSWCRSQPPWQQRYRRTSLSVGGHRMGIVGERRCWLGVGTSDCPIDLERGEHGSRRLCLLNW